MSEQLLWESDVVDWEKISVDSYKFVIEQAKEQLNEIIEESQTITKRGMSILSIYSFTLLFQLIYPKDVFYKGSPPKEIFYNDVFNGQMPDEGLKNIMYGEIE